MMPLKHATGYVDKLQPLRLPLEPGPQPYLPLNIRTLRERHYVSIPAIWKLVRKSPILGHFMTLGKLGTRDIVCKILIWTVLVAAKGRWSLLRFCHANIGQVHLRT